MPGIRTPRQSYNTTTDRAEEGGKPYTTEEQLIDLINQRKTVLPAEQLDVILDTFDITDPIARENVVNVVNQVNQQATQRTSTSGATPMGAPTPGSYRINPSTGRVIELPKYNGPATGVEAPPPVSTYRDEEGNIVRVDTEGNKTVEPKSTTNSSRGTYSPYSSWQQYSDIFSQRPKYEIPTEVQDLLSEYQTGAQKLEDLYGASRRDILGEARRAGRQGLEATKQYGENALDIMRTRAYGGLPGERQYYEQQGAMTAGAIRDITQRGGGGSQGALADIYSQQMAGQRDILASRAQYQGAGMEGLASLTRQTGLDLSNQYRTMAQDYINANLASTQALGGATDRATQMRTAGLGTMAGYKDTQWQYNKYQPALAREAAYMDYMNKLQDQAFTQEMSMYNTGSAQNYAMMSNAIGGQTTAYQSFLNTVGQGLGNYAQLNLLNNWMAS